MAKPEQGGTEAVFCRHHTVDLDRVRIMQKLAPCVGFEVETILVGGRGVTYEVPTETGQVIVPFEDERLARIAIRGPVSAKEERIKKFYSLINQAENPTPLQAHSDDGMPNGNSEHSRLRHYAAQLDQMDNEVPDHLRHRRGGIV